MRSRSSLQYVQRASIDGALCTIRCHIAAGTIPGTKGDWLGVEWDDPARGKHNGTYHGKQYFQCQSIYPTVASFIRPSRKLDSERTVLEAIKYKYASAALDERPQNEVVVISGKVAEEVGFDKIAQEQSLLGQLKIVVLEQLLIYGIAPRGASEEQIRVAQVELLTTCPNIVELDLGHNPIEQWSDVIDICAALPKLKILRLNGVRLFLPLSTKYTIAENIFENLQELHLNECLLQPVDVLQLMKNSGKPQFPALSKLWLSQNEMETFTLPEGYQISTYESVNELVLENNLFNSLDDNLSVMMAIYPRLKHLSLQNNRISKISDHNLLRPGSKANAEYVSLQSLGLAQNKIQAFDFVDAIAVFLPNLSALRISKNPLYDTPQSNFPGADSSETNYYLTLARIPTLKTLNYSQITTRERDEGEIYYLSTAEKQIKAMISRTNSDSTHAEQLILQIVESQYPQYQRLCQKHDRESTLKQFSSTFQSPEGQQLLEESYKPNYPPGSIAANLIEATFYLAGTDNTSQQQNSESESYPLIRQIPYSIPTSQLFALIAQKFNLPPLQFNLIYESNELDPAGVDFSTRSQLYNLNSKDAQGAQERYQAWGDWDADALVEASASKLEHDKTDVPLETKQESPGVLIKDGKRWKKREVHILLSLRDWGDWLDDGVRNVTIRIEPV